MNEGTGKNKNYLKALANQYVAMSQKGTVGFFEETVISDLVDYFLSEGKELIALDLVDYGMSIHPYSSHMIYLKAEILYHGENFAGALYELDNAISLDPADNNSIILKARILMKMGRYEQAKEILQVLGDIDDYTMSNVHLCFASIYENLDRYGDMFDSLCDASRADWDNEDILERLGLCTEFCEKHEEHIVFLNEYLDERPYSAVAWYNLGLSHWFFKNYGKAIEAFEYAFIIDKFFHQAYLDCAEVLVKIKNYDKALFVYNNALDHWPKDGDLYIGKGNCLFRMKQFDKAFNSYQEAAYYSPENAEGFYGKGLCMLESGDAKNALQHLAKAIYLDPRKEEYAAAMGETYYRMGNIKAAAKAFNKAIELAPEISGYWIRNISFLMDENRYDEAFENIQAAIENTFGTELLYCQAAYHFRTGNRKEGISILQKAMNEDYNKHSSLLDLCPELDKDNEVMSIIATYRHL